MAKPKSGKERKRDECQSKSKRPSLVDLTIKKKRGREKERNRIERGPCGGTNEKGDFRTTSDWPA